MKIFRNEARLLLPKLPVRLGIYLDLRQPEKHIAREIAEDYEAALLLCSRAEELGLDSVWLSEHHLFPDGYLPQPLTFASAVAARTERVRIGTAVTLAPIRSAPHIAEEATIVDLISAGRLDLGLGAGYAASEFELFGADWATRTASLFAVVEEVQHLLATTVTPAPVQSPFPVWVGTNGHIGARMTGQLGLPLLSARKELVEDYLIGLEAGGHGRSSGRMAGPVNVFLSDDPDRDRDAVAAYYRYLWETYAAAFGTSSRTVDVAEALRRGLAGGLRGLLVATPSEAAELLLTHFADTPVETVFAWAWLPGIRGHLVDRHVELWCTELKRLVESA